jgi:hypothetical protein
MKTMTYFVVTMVINRQNCYFFIDTEAMVAIVTLRKFLPIVQGILSYYHTIGTSGDMWLLNTNGLHVATFRNMGSGSGWLSISSMSFLGVCNF